MAANPGRNPFAGNDSPPLVDIRYRNGIIARAVDPNKRRWVRWQLSETKDYELVWPVDEKVGNSNLNSISASKSAA